MHVIRNTSVSFLSSLKEKRKRYSAGIFGTATTLKKFNDPPNIFRSSLNPPSLLRIHLTNFSRQR